MLECSRAKSSNSLTVSRQSDRCVMEEFSNEDLQMCDDGNELDKLRLANKLANNLLEKTQELSLDELLEKSHSNSDEDHVARARHLDEIDYYTSQAETPEQKFSFSSNDRWGANEYLKDGNRFNFVTEYLNRTETLLNMRNAIKASPCSYELVSSTSDLLNKPTTPSSDFDGRIERNDDRNKKPMTLNEDSQPNQLVADLSTAYNYNNEKISKNLHSHDEITEYSGIGFATHRPIGKDCGLNVFSPMESSTNQLQYKAREELKHECWTNTKREESNNKEKCEEINVNSDNLMSFVENAFDDSNYEHSSDLDFILAGVEHIVPEKSHAKPTRNEPVPRTQSLPLLSMLMQSSESSAFFQSMYDNAAIDEINIAEGEAGIKNEVLQPDDKDMNIDQANIESRQHVIDDVIPPLAYANDKQTDNTIVTFDIPKLDLSDGSDKEYLATNVKHKRNEVKWVNGNSSNKLQSCSMRNRVRPRSAGSKINQKASLPLNEIKYDNTDSPQTSPAKNNKLPKSPSKRPASAGKLNGIQISNTSPKRVWEKSSIAWSSYGRRQLNTWSSVNNLQPVKLPSTKGNAVSLTTIQNQKSHKTGTYVRENFIVNGSGDYNMLNKLKQPQNMWDDMPDEIVIYLFQFLSSKDLLNVSKVCHKFYRIAGDCQLWKSLKVTDITLTDRWFELMGKRNPKIVSIRNCQGKQVTNKGLRNFFRHCKFALENLDVGNCTGDLLSGDSVLLHASCHCRNLRHVSVPWSRTTDNGISAICLALPTVESLNINGNSSVGDEAFAILRERHAKSLKSLKMSGCFAVSSDALLALIEETNCIETLNIGLCSKVTSDCIMSLGKNLSMLEHLDLHGVKSVTNRCLHLIATHCKKLKSLTISNCTSVSDIGLAEISTYINTLSHLDAGGCAEITDQGISNFVAVAKEIEYLDISGTGATQMCVDVITKCSSKPLTTLKLSFCHNITHNCLVNLLNVATSLRSLHLYGCKRLKLSSLMKVNRNVVIEK